jgi:hypothetical protein
VSWGLAATIVVNEAQFPEPVHKKTHPRTSGSYHFRQGLLADLRNDGLRNPFLAKTSEHQKHTDQSLFAGIEQLVDQVLFITDIARQQMRYEQIGNACCR